MWTIVLLEVEGELQYNDYAVDDYVDGYVAAP